MEILELLLVGAAVLAGAVYAAWRLRRAWSGRGCSDCAFSARGEETCRDCPGAAECRGDEGTGTGEDRRSTSNVQHPTFTDEDRKGGARN